jgi:membrane dipeptidase
MDTNSEFRIQNSEFFVMDGHQDALYYAGHNGGTARFDAGWAEAQLDLPSLRASRVAASFWAIFGEGEIRPEHDAPACVAETDRLMAGYRAWIESRPAEYQLLLTAADLDALAGAVEAGETAPFGVLLHCEGARGIGGPDHLAALHAQGLRSLGLTWNHANAYATGATGDPAVGLTPAGRDLVRTLNELHMAIDAAHLNRQGVWDLLETTTAPVLVTHTGCAALYDYPRNIADDQIKAVAAGGGVIGVFMANIFLAAAGTPVTLDTLLAHYDHLLDLVGPDHVALGTDFGGVSSGTPKGVEITRDLPRLLDAFAARGYPPETIRAICGGNYRRVLGQILG